MESVRKPFQGVLNIVRFNWHFYVLVALILVVVLSVALLSDVYMGWLIAFSSILFATVVISLAVSWYVYDHSTLYTLSWLDQAKQDCNALANIHSGFDETSALLQQKYPDARLRVFDFYDREKHTEVSIRRARKMYPPYTGTQRISTSHIPVVDASFDTICVILSAHEIRDEAERIVFFCELHRVLKPNGRIIVTEHLRDLPNFFAYNIGCLHFFSRSAWVHTFAAAKLEIHDTNPITPFIATFILQKHGAAS